MPLKPADMETECFLMQGIKEVLNNIVLYKKISWSLLNSYKIIFLLNKELPSLRTFFSFCSLQDIMIIIYTFRMDFFSSGGWDDLMMPALVNDFNHIIRLWMWYLSMLSNKAEIGASFKWNSFLCFGPREKVSCLIRVVSNLTLVWKHESYFCLLCVSKNAAFNLLTTGELREANLSSWQPSW